MSLLTLFIVLALVAGVFGGWGHRAHGADWGYAGWSPLGVVLLLALVLYVGGYLH